MSVLRASEIRELLKITQRPEVISFAGGLPAPEFFPTEEMKAVTADVLEHHGREAMQYSTTEGHPPLRAWIAARMNARLGTGVEPADVLVTSASQQGLDLTGKVFLDEGDEVLCESPTYIGAIGAFRTFGARFVEVPTDDEGMIVGELERLLLAHDRVKLVYVVPDSQNPSGRTWSLARRRAFMDVVSLYRIPVVEDSPYREIRFEDNAPPALKAMDVEGQVIFLGTFSKIFSPGIRIGWVAAPCSILEKYVLVKQSTDLHTSTLAQMQLASYLERFDLDANLERVREAYRRRRDVMIRALERELPEGVRFTRPSGGLFLWVELPDGSDARGLLAACLERDVAFVPGGSFFPNGGHENTLRLNFSNMPEERIEEGIRRLGVVVREMLGRGRKDRMAAAG